MELPSREQIKAKIQAKSTDELLAIYKKNDRDIYSDAAFSAIYEILKERSVDVPVQAFIKTKPEEVQKGSNSEKESYGRAIGCFVLYVIVYVIAVALLWCLPSIVWIWLFGWS